jgi:16S rRNA (guanine527-N7)-methyltransferase
MTADASQRDEFRRALRSRAGRYAIDLNEDYVRRLSNYYELLLTWNPRVHLVAPCSPTEFATRHVLESLLLLPHLSANACVADIGSGAGLPLIPTLITRADVHAVLFESSHQKAVFLSEALRTTATSEQANVIAERFENIPAPEVDYVTCRALDRFVELFPRLVQWSPQRSKLLLFGGEGLQDQIERVGLRFSAVKIPDSERRFLYLCR